MNDQDHRPAEPVEDDKGQPLGFAGLARELSKEFPERPRPFSRQLVHKWFINRHYNQFPEPVAYVGTGHGRARFEFQTVYSWYVWYLSTRGGDPREQQNTTTASATAETTSDTSTAGRLAA